MYGQPPPTQAAASSSRHDVALSISPLPESSSTTAVPPPSQPPPPLSANIRNSSREDFLKFGLPLYKAALEGNWASAGQILHQSPDWIRKPIAKGGERVLHIAAAAKRTHFVKELVKLMSRDDLTLSNDAKNTALCLAATSGVVEIAKVMVDKNDALPIIRGSRDMTPLQMAVLLGRRDMVWYLITVTDDDQLTDVDRIAILTSSINTNLFDVANHLLIKHPELALLRNGKEETALHTLARKPVRSGSYHEQSIWKTLVGLGGKLAQGKVPQQPLELQLVQRIWDEVIKQEEKKISFLIGSPWRLLFIAAKCGNVEFLTTLIRTYPDLIWKVDEENRSIFHIAIIYRHEEIFKLIYELGAIKDLIAVDKDGNGNNMLHLAGALAPSHRLNCVSGAALQMQRELLWFKAVEKVVSSEYAEAENNNHKTPRALFTEKHEGLRIKGEEWMKQTAQSCSVVTTLIATVVFAAAFTLPGGNDSKGAPMFVHRPLFIVFSICNALSLSSSSASLLMFLSILTSRYAEHDFVKSLPLKLMLGLTGMFISIVTMMAAFTATFFITFRQGLYWIPIPIALFAAVPVALFAFQQYPLLLDIYQSTYRSWSLFQPTKPKLFPSYPT
ncbi:ankyrin repeat-containing protein ITN1-like isoform X1 [Chenopodium quinoa]|uniref:PGG domain-containing protein n=1 Tax=Chenopodium quinoa TaxID=63459 RepID=A0A803M225_CHEQI|nr:ankyrin repeat-containing protein ITN1-like isoform X1 [Chenopodium quinoa]